MKRIKSSLTRHHVPAGRAARQRVENAHIDADVVRFYREGRTQAEIAQRIGRNQATVSRVLARVGERLQVGAEEELALARREAVAELDRVQARLWRAYEKSKLPRTTARRGRQFGGRRGVVVTTTEERPEGDVRLLEAIRKNVESQARIMGLLGPPPRTPDLDRGHGGD